ncbi:hypothetical protein ACLOJK_037829 [Asimina triloba]
MRGTGDDSAAAGEGDEAAAAAAGDGCDDGSLLSAHLVGLGPRIRSKNKATKKSGKNLKLCRRSKMFSMGWFYLLTVKDEEARMWLPTPHFVVQFAFIDSVSTSAHHLLRNNHMSGEGFLFCSISLFEECHLHELLLFEMYSLNMKASNIKEAIRDEVNAVVIIFAKGVPYR